MTIYKCPHCRTEYGLIMARLSFRQRSYANCQVCHKTMYSWNSSSVPRFTLVRRSDAITPGGASLNDGSARTNQPSTKRHGDDNA